MQEHDQRPLARLDVVQPDIAEIGIAVAHGHGAYSDALTFAGDADRDGFRSGCDAADQSVLGAAPARARSTSARGALELRARLLPRPSRSSRSPRTLGQQVVALRARLVGQRVDDLRGPLAGPKAIAERDGAVELDDRRRRDAASAA